MIRATDIHKSFGTLEVLKGVSLDVAQGEVVSIVGASGAGKTTLLQIIGTLSRPDGGRVEIDGRDVSALGDRALSQFRNERIGFVFQFHHLLAEFTAFENVCIPGLIGRRPRVDVERRAAELLDMMGLAARRDHKPGQLSGGEQQRVAIARALATHPKVLLCDEATSALDPNTTRQILELIRDINQKLNITVVVITHQMSVVKEICSHVAILDEGRVAESGLVGTVFAAPKSAAGRRLVFPGGADAQVYDPSEEKLVRLVFKDSKTTSIPLIARLAAEENIFCNVISASTQKLSETVYGSMMLGIPSAQFDKAVAFIHNVANVQVEEVDSHVQ